MMRPSLTTNAANGPPLPERTFSSARAIARFMNSGDMPCFQPKPRLYFPARNRNAPFFRCAESLNSRSNRAAGFPAGLASIRIGGRMVHWTTWVCIHFRPVSERGRMIRITNVSIRDSEFLSGRRGFLKGMLGAGAFVLSVRLMPEELFGAAPNATASEAMSKAQLQPSVYLAINTDGTAYIIAHRSEMGSGSRTALPRIVADELDADWTRVKLVQATGDEKYGDQDTDGSHSVRSFFDT